MTRKLPVTLLAGPFGAGKTTLLERVLSGQHGKRLAVISDELRCVSVNGALAAEATVGSLERKSGPLCCTGRGDLLRVLRTLTNFRDRFDHVVIETTGNTYPLPVAQMFFVDDDLREVFALDGIVTVANAKDANARLDDSSECKEQLAFADLVVLNNTDLLRPDDLDALTGRIARLNAKARVHCATKAAASHASVLNLGGFLLDRVLAARPSFLSQEYPFGWVGTFDVTNGFYDLVLAEGPLTTTDLVIQYLGPHERGLAKVAADNAARVWSQDVRACKPGSELSATTSEPFRLMVGRGKPKHFYLRTPKAGRIGLYTQHLPSAFQMRLLHGGRELEPTSEGDFPTGHNHDLPDFPTKARRRRAPAARREP